MSQPDRSNDPDPRVQERDGLGCPGRSDFSLIEILDGDDPRVRDFTSLTDVALRRVREPAEGLFMAESLEVIKRAVAGGYSVRSILTEAKWLKQVEQILPAASGPDSLVNVSPVPASADSGSAPASPSPQTSQIPRVPVYVAERDVLKKITGYRMHRGLLAAMQRQESPAPATVLAGAERVLVLDGLVDHTNVGAAFRSAAAMGIDAVLVTSRCADPLYRRSVRVSMGTVFQVPWTTVGDDSLTEVLAGHNTVALTPSPEAEDLAKLARSLRGPTALIVGSEGPGLSAKALRQSDHRARIPMAGNVDSLNVAAAVAVACHILTGAG